MDGQLEQVELARLRHTKVSIGKAPAFSETLEFGQSQRALTITDIEYWNGEIFVAGVSNEEFASTLRRVSYPFGNSVSISTIEIWHAAHGQFETRAPIITQVVREIEGVPYLIAAYTCTPLVRRLPPLAVSGPPTLQLTLTVAQDGHKFPAASKATTLEQSQHLDPITNGTSTVPSLQGL